MSSKLHIKFAMRQTKNLKKKKNLDNFANFTLTSKLFDIHEVIYTIIIMF